MRDELTIEFVNSAADWKAWLRYRLAKLCPAVTKQFLMGLLWLCFVIVLVLVVTGARDLRNPAIGVFAILVFGTFLFIVVVRLLSLFFLIRKFDREARRLLPSALQRITVSPEGLRLSISDHAALSPWSTIGSIELNENAIYITGRRDIADVIIVPRHAFSDNESFRVFDETIKDFLQTSTTAPEARAELPLAEDNRTVSS